MIAATGKVLALLLLSVIIVGVVAGLIIKDIYAMRADSTGELNESVET